MRKGRPYAECPKCGSAAVDHPASGRPGYRCTRCRYQAATFARRALDPSAFDSRPRDGGRVMPIIYERD